MGHGRYTLLGWGVLTPPRHNDATGRDDDVERTMVTLDLRMARKAEPDYLVIPLAVDDLPLQSWWHLPPLPDWVGEVAPHTAWYLDANPSGLDAEPRCLDVLGSAVGRARATWLEVQQVYAEAGLDLPEGRLVLLSDKD